MKRKWLTAAGVLVIAGILLFGIGFAQGGVDDLSEDVEKKTSEYAPEEVTSLFAELTSADVTVEASEDGKVTVEYYTAGHDGIDVAVKDGVLKITQWNKRDWWEYFSFHLADSRKVTVKVPMSLESLDVSTASGEIEVKGAQVAGEGAIGSTSGGHNRVGHVRGPRSGHDVRGDHRAGHRGGRGRHHRHNERRGIAGARAGGRGHERIHDVRVDQNGWNHRKNV